MSGLMRWFSDYAADVMAAAHRRAVRDARTAQRRAENMPRKNTPKAQRPRNEVRPCPPLTAVGIAALGHAPRPRKRTKR